MLKKHLFVLKMASATGYHNETVRADPCICPTSSPYIRPTSSLRIYPNASNDTKPTLALIIGFALLTLLQACQTDPSTETTAPSKRLHIVYMIADNNLDRFSVQDINEMESSLPVDTQAKLIVYIDRGKRGIPAHPYLLEIKPDTTEDIISPVILSFPEQNSSNADILQSTLEEIFALYPHHQYIPTGLILWSHGNAWLPDGVAIPSARDQNTDIPLTKSFGLDNTPEESTMGIPALSQVLSNYHFDFILFDACFMGSIEVLYELQNTTNYIIASSTEVLSSGFPYQKITPLLFQKQIKYTNIAQTYYEHYQQLSGTQQSTSIAVVKTQELPALTESINIFNQKLKY